MNADRSEEYSKMDDTGEIGHVKLVRSKNKAAYLKHRDIYADLKPRKRGGKCLGAAVLEDADAGLASPAPQPPAYNVISSDIWFHIADHIRPEDVQTFALICRETAELVNTRKFWRNLYELYCRKPNQMQCNYKLPARLHRLNIYSVENRQALRASVIAALFHCHAPLVERNYTLDKLQGRTYTASWHQQCQCIWIMCYKFWNQFSTNENASPKRPAFATEVLDDWESLLTNGCYDSDEDAAATTSRKFTNPHEGVSLLVIFCKRFIPFPTQLLYGQSCSAAAPVRLLAARQMLAQDMRGSTLELDFVDVISKAVTTVKYPSILKYKILPWWHPDFGIFVK